MRKSALKRRNLDNVTKKEADEEIVRTVLKTIYVASAFGSRYGEHSQREKERHISRRVRETIFAVKK